MRRLAAAAGTGLGLFVLAMAGSHLLEPQLNLHAVGDYAAGPYGWLARSGFIGFGVALTALASLLWRELPDTLPGRAAPLLLLVAGLAGLGLALTAGDSPGPPSTFTGLLHQRLSSLLALASSLAILLLGVVATEERRWRGAGWSLTLGFALTLLWLFDSLGAFDSQPAWAAVASRLVYALVAVWFAASLVQAWSLAARGGQTPT